MYKIAVTRTIRYKAYMASECGTFYGLTTLESAEETDSYYSDMYIEEERDILGTIEVDEYTYDKYTGDIDQVVLYGKKLWFERLINGAVSLGDGYSKPVWVKMSTYAEAA